MAFKLCKKGNCGVTITDLNEYQIQSYLTRSSTIYYTFMQSASINTLSSINYEGESTLQAYKINTHYETDEHLPVPDESDLDFVIDGLYEGMKKGIDDKKLNSKISNLANDFPINVSKVLKNKAKTFIKKEEIIDTGASGFDEDLK